MTFTDDQLRAYADHRCRPSQCPRHMEEEHDHQRRLAAELLDARKALEAVPHLRILAGAIVEDHQERSHNTETCVSIGGACNARRILGE